jgi:hypothetical protein
LTDIWYSKTDIKTDRCVDKPKDRQTERDLLMGRQTDRQTDGCTNYRDRLVDEQVEMLINGQTDRQMYRPGCVFTTLHFLRNLRMAPIV